MLKKAYKETKKILNRQLFCAKNGTKTHLQEKTFDLSYFLRKLIAENYSVVF
jgi:hypothetical protein